MSAPQRAVMLAARDLAAEGVQRADLATLQVRAKAYPGGEKVKDKTVNGLVTGCKLSRSGGLFGLTEAGRVRLREGL